MIDQLIDRFINWMIDLFIITFWQTKRKHINFLLRISINDCSARSSVSKQFSIKQIFFRWNKVKHIYYKTLENAKCNKKENRNHSKPLHPRLALRDLAGVFFYAYKYMESFFFSSKNIYLKRTWACSWTMYYEHFQNLKYSYKTWSLMTLYFSIRRR